MNHISKFDGIDYRATFGKRIGAMHALVKHILSKVISDGDSIIDIGGGPGMGARLLEELGIAAAITNIEPSSSIDEIPALSRVSYIPLKMSFQEAARASMICEADSILMVSAAHEIALGYGELPAVNKQIFFRDLGLFINKNLHQNGNLIIGFPNYRTGASGDEISRQRKLTEILLGHSHPPDELFTVEEFASAMDTQPSVFVQRPMDLTGEHREAGVLVANVAVFKINK